MDKNEMFQRALQLYYHDDTKIEGLALLEAAYEEGSARAAKTLGVHYLELQAYQKANEYFEQGALWGDGDCMYFLADAYGAGKGKEVDHIKAYELVLQAVENGCEVESYMLALYKRYADEAKPKGIVGALKRIFGR